MLEFRCGWVGVVSVWQAEAVHPNPTTPKLQHTSKQEHTTSVVIEKPQAPDGGCINARNMLSIEEVK